MSIQWSEKQQAVIDARGCSVLVSAAAGSGKTAVLVERLIRLLTDEKHPVDIERLLVVTFTNAAAAEMRERIGRGLDQKLLEEPDRTAWIRQKLLLPCAQISTIHSLCLKTIREHFEVLDLDPSFRLGDEAELKLLKSDVAEDVMETYYASENRAFRAFVDRYANGKTDQGIAEMIIALYDYSRGFPWPEYWLKHCLAAYSTDEEHNGADQVKEFAMMQLNNVLTKYLPLFEEARAFCLEPNGVEAYLSVIEDDKKWFQMLGESEDYDGSREILHKIVWKRLPRTAASVDPKIKEKVKEIHADFKSEIEGLRDGYFVHTFEELKAELTYIRPSVRMLIELTEVFGQQFMAVKNDRNMLDFSDLEHYMLQLLADFSEDEQGQMQVKPTSAADELSEFYEEVVCDEYQDSNQVQELILSLLSRERKGQYNRFMVGDVKQSIYRFRLADAAIFMEKYHHYALGESQKTRQRIDLSQNFRSRESVLSGVNYIFRKIMKKSLGGIDYDDQAALYPGAEYPENDNVKTEILVMDSDLEILSKEEDFEEKIPSERELEARMIAMRIRELLRSQKVTDKETGELRNVRYSDIVILTRSIKGFADVFTEVLNREGIPTYAGTSEGYFQTQEIGVLMDYLRVLDNRRQDIPLTAVLSSAFAGLSQEELAEIRCAYPDTAFFESVTKYREQGENADIQLKLQKCLDQMDDFRKIVPYTPMHELLWKILETTGYGDYVASMPGGAQRKANLDMLIEKARAYESTSYKGLFHFVRYIEQLQKYDVDYGEASIEDEHADTVRVMTIHKSKGLEFPVVIVAGMGKRFNMQDARSAVALHAGMGVGLDAVNLEYRTKIPSIIKKVIQKEEALESLGEELRVLYVALTRAKEKLIITGTLSNPEDKISDGRVFQGNKRKELSFLLLSHAVTYWDFILPAVLRTEGEPLKLQILHVEDVVKESIEEEEKSGISRAVLENWDVNEIYEPKLHDMMKEQFEFIYPYEKSSMRKLKFTVTELKKRAYEIGLDGGEEEREEEGELLQEEPEVVPMIPQFLQEDEVLAGAARGTAYHRVMELLDMKGMPEFTEDTAGEKENWKKYFMDWLDDQVRRGRIEEDAARCICWEDILQFAKSGIGRRLREADGKQRLWREQPFVLGIDARELYPEEEDGELILVQGIIDAYFEEPDGLVVLDYKTDKIRRKEELAERYQEQLRYYAKALEQMTGKKVKEKIIYSFTLKEGIYIK